MRMDMSGRLSTEPVLLLDIIASIRNGEIKVPQFQRKFVWEDRQALQLLDSLASNYPIGSILLWRTREKLAAERNIGPFPRVRQRTWSVQLQVKPSMVSCRMVASFVRFQTSVSCRSASLRSSLCGNRARRSPRARISSFSYLTIADNGTTRFRNTR